MSCCQSCVASQQFDRSTAARDLRRFRRRGPDAATRALVDAVRARPLPPAPKLIDVGGGVGAIHHLLLGQGYSEAIQFDASDSYLAAATQESSRLGHADRVRFEFGDFAAVGDSLPVADVVTLHRVVCCDANGPGLLETAASHARHLVAFSYPRPRWITRVFVWGFNAVRRLTREPFRLYLHPRGALVDALERGGLQRVWTGGTWLWAIELFQRPA